MSVISNEDIQGSLSCAVGKLIDEGRIRLNWDSSAVYSIYILQVNQEVWDCRRCSNNLGEEFRGATPFYVGMTKNSRDERINQHHESRANYLNQVDSSELNKEYWTRGAKMTREHGFRLAEEIEPRFLDGELFDGRLRKDDAKLLEQIVIPTALRALGFAAYAGAAEEFTVVPKSR
jgi:hypothetical protein